MIIGRRACGKTLLARNILQNHNDIPNGKIIIHPADEEFFKKVAPPSFIETKYIPKITKDLLERQKTASRIASEHKAADPRSFFLIDDIVGVNKWSKDNSLIKLIDDRRKLHQMAIIVCQCLPMKIPNLRESLDLVFLMGRLIESEQVRIFNQFGLMFDSLEDFREVLERCTTNHGCLVLDLAGNRAYTYRARLINARLGADVLWKVAKYAHG